MSDDGQAQRPPPVVVSPAAEPDRPLVSDGEESDATPVADPAIPVSRPMPDRPVPSWEEPDLLTGAELLHHWNFDEPSGNEVKDLAGGANGVVLGGQVERVVGLQNGAVHVTRGIEFEQLNLGEDFTVATWIRIERMTDEPKFLLANCDYVGLREELDGVAFLIESGINSTDKGIGVRTHHAGVSQGTTRPPQSMATGHTELLVGRWVHVAFTVKAGPGSSSTRDQITVTPYVNGRGEKAAGQYWNKGEPPPRGGKWRIGASLDGRARSDITIDDFRIYRGSLTADQIRALAEVREPPAWLVHHWTFDEAEQGRYVDQVSDYIASPHERVTNEPGRHGEGIVVGDGNVAIPSTAFGEQFSLAFWMKPHHSQRTNTLMNLRSGNDRYLRISVPASSSGLTGALSVLSSPDEPGLRSRSLYTEKSLFYADQWTHVAVTVDVPTRRLMTYINGERKLDTTIGSAVSLAPWELGVVNDSQSTMTTTLDDVQVYWGILKQQQIRELAAGEKTDIRHVALPAAPAPIGNTQGNTRAEVALMHHWKFDEQAGRSVRDAVSGRVSQIRCVEPDKTWGEGVDGGALNLGTAVCELPPVELQHGNTFAFWMRTNEIHPDRQAIFHVGNPETGVLLYADDYKLADGSLHLDVDRNRGGTELDLAPGSVPYGQWTHVVAVVPTSGSAQLYVNGVSAGKKSLGLPDVEFAPLRLGCTYDDEAFGRAWIDDLMIFRGALSDEQIASLYTTANAGVLRDDPGNVNSLPKNNNGKEEALLWNFPWQGQRMLSAFEAPHVVLLDGKEGGALSATVWDLRHGARLYEFSDGHRPEEMALSDHGKWMLSIGKKAGEDAREVRIWVLPEGRLQASADFPLGGDARILSFDVQLNKFIVFAEQRLHHIDTACTQQQIHDVKFDSVYATHGYYPNVVFLRDGHVHIYSKNGERYLFENRPSKSISSDSIRAEFEGRRDHIVSLHRRRVDGVNHDYISMLRMGVNNTPVSADFGDLDLSDLCVAPRGNVALATAADGTLCMYSPHSSRKMLLPVRHLGFTPADAVLVGIPGEPILFLDPHFGHPLIPPVHSKWMEHRNAYDGVRPFEQPDQFIGRPFLTNQITFSPDGLTAVSWGEDVLSQDSSIRTVWKLPEDVITGKWSDDHVSKKLAVSPGGHWCLSAGKSKENGAEIRLWRLPGGSVTSLNKLPDRTHIYSVEWTNNGAYGYVFCDAGVYAYNYTGRFEKLSDKCAPHAALCVATGEVFAVDGKKVRSFRGVKEMISGTVMSELGEVEKPLGLSVAADGSAVFVVGAGTGEEKEVVRFDLEKKTQKSYKSSTVNEDTFIASPTGESFLPAPGTIDSKGKVQHGYTMSGDILHSSFGGRIENFFISRNTNLTPKFELPTPRTPPRQSTSTLADAQSPSEPTFRTWKSANGRFAVEAEFVKLIGDSVYLKRKDNQQEVKVPLGALSQDDQDFIRQR